MTGTAEIAQVLALLFALGVGVLVLWVAARRLLQSLLVKRVETRVVRVQAILKQHRKDAFKATERLLFQLGELADVAAIETVLNEELDRSDDDRRPGLVRLYRALGIVDRYRKQLLESTRWTERVGAAHALGRLHAVEAVPELVLALRDPHEDARSVKLAAAQALGRLRSSEAVPLLIAELEAVDEWASPRIAEILATIGETAVAPLIETLHDEQLQNARVWAAQILGRIGDPGSVSALAPFLRDRSEHVRMSVAEALGRLGDRRSVGDLVRVALRDPVPPVRAEAARALGAIGDPDVVRSLVELLGDPDYWTRLRAIEAIEAIGPQDVTPLEAALRDPSAEVRRRAAVALERVGVLQQSVQALRGDDRAATARATATLVEMGRAGLLDSIVSYLDHEDFRVRARVAEALGAVGDRRAVEPLRTALEDDQWPVRARAAESIGRLRPEQGVQILLPALSDDEETVREAAAEALRSLGPPARREELNRVFALFDSGNAMVRCTVVEAVGTLASARVDELLARALTDPSPDVRLRAAQAVASQARELWVDDLVELLGDPDTRARAAAATALGRIGTDEALERLVRHLDTPDRAFREALTSALADHGVEVVLRSVAEDEASVERSLALVWALGKTGSGEAVARLQALAEHTSAAVRAAVGGALGKLASHPETGTVLQRLLRDRNERVRAAAVNALARLGRAETVDVLLPARDDPDAFVRARVSLALGQLGGDAAIEALRAMWERDSSPEERAAVIVGFALTGREEGLEAALTHLDEPAMQTEVERLLARSTEEVSERFHRNLHLGLGAAGEESALSRRELAEHYIGVLRNHQRPEARAAAVTALQAIGVTPHRDLLVDTVRTDPDPDVRRLALAALVSDGVDAWMSDLLGRALRDPSIGVQVEAAGALAELADSSFNTALLGAFRSGHAELNAAAVTALTAANLRRVAELVDELMGHSEPAILQGGAQTLGAIGDPRATGILGAWLTSREPDLRRASVAALGQIGTVEAREAVMESLADPAESVRLASLDALGHLHGSDVLEAAAALVSDPSVPVRVALARLVGRSRNPDAIDLAEDLCDDPQERVRLEALVSLLLVGNRPALERFTAVVAGQPEHVRQSLSALQPSHEAVERTVTTFRSDRRAGARAVALQALAGMGHRPVDVLLEALRDPAPEVRIAAVGVAAASDNDELSAALQTLLDDPDSRVRDAVRKSKLSLIG